MFALLKFYKPNKNLLWGLILFLALNITLFLFIAGFHDKVPFNKFNYSLTAYHYLQDTRVTGDGFSLVNSLGQYDGQWYLRIADQGYPRNSAPTYAFFPLYPTLVAGLKLVTHNVEIAAFWSTLFFLPVNFLSLYWVISRLYSEKITLRTIFLIFAFPFSIFFRSYFPEGIYLFLFVWFCYFLATKRLTLASIPLSFLNLVKANGWLLNLLFLYYLYKALTKKEITRSQLFLSLAIIATPLLLWGLYMYFHAGNPLIFYEARKAWVPFGFPFTLLYNIVQIFRLPVLRFHSFFSSQVEILFFLAVFLLFKKSKKQINFEFWLSSFVLWIFPFFTNVFMSFSRYQIVLFPLFIFLALKLSDRAFYLVFTIFTILLFAISLPFVNWYWIG